MAQADLGSYDPEYTLILSDVELAQLNDGTQGSAAGWYIDPLTPNAVRYWSGRSWTARVRHSKVVAEPVAQEVLEKYEPEQALILSAFQLAQLNAAARGSTAGWYVDPGTTETARYWSGHSWTARIRRSGNGVPRPKPLPKPTAVSRRVAAAEGAGPTTGTTQCSDCGGTVSRRAETCIHCGAPLQPSGAPLPPSAIGSGILSQREVAQATSSGVFWGVLRVLLFLVGLLIVLYGCYAASLNGR